MTPYLFLLDMFGVIAFSVAASLMAYRRNLDPFGIVVIAIITAIGGGTLRDVLLRNYPIFWIANPMYLVVIFFSSMATQVLHKYISRIERLLLFFDAIGIGVFTIIGIKISLNFNLPPVICITMGTITAVFGGVIRDALCNELPVILHRELYATLCILGGVIFFVLRWMNVPVEVNYSVSMLVIVITRMLSVMFNLSLPSIPFL